MFNNNNDPQLSFIRFLGEKSAENRFDEYMEKEAILGWLGKGMSLLGRGVGAVGRGASAAGRAAKKLFTGRTAGAAGAGARATGAGARSAGATGTVGGAGARAAGAGTSAAGAGTSAAVAGTSAADAAANAAKGNVITRRPLASLGAAGLGIASVNDLLTPDFKGTATLMHGEGQLGDYLKNPITGLLYQLGLIKPYTPQDIGSSFDTSGLQLTMDDLEYDPTTGQYKVSPNAIVNIKAPWWLDELRRRNESRSTYSSSILPPGPQNEAQRSTGGGRYYDKYEYDPFESTLGRRYPLRPIERGR